MSDVRVRQAGNTERDGRLAKARQFAQVCELIVDDARRDGGLADAYVTLAVHAGIAAADAICIGAIGEYSVGGNHDQAATLLAKVDRKVADQLRRLLALKTKAGYGHSPATAADVKTAERAHTALIQRAER